MNLAESNPPGLASEASEERLEQIRAELHRLEKRDWWLWVMAVVVMLFLTLAVVSLSFPGLIRLNDPIFQFSLDQSVRGLVGLVLLFNAYSIYQQAVVKRLRRQFSEQLDTVARLRLRAEEFHRLATTDALTGLANRRTGEERLALEIARSQRYGYPLTLIAFDLNRFKQINDQFGHAAGDLVLTAFAHKLARTLRASDLAVRIGGDEFLAVLPECKVDQASSLISRLKPIEVTHKGTPLQVEFAAGAVGYKRGETLAQFVERADQRLYEQKRESKAGRDRQQATARRS
jgi:diguanylate cyclase (GGDEF)-like protein